MTSDGHRVRTGLLYRCGHLANATDADVDVLEQLGRRRDRRPATRRRTGDRGREPRAARREGRVPPDGRRARGARHPGAARVGRRRADQGGVPARCRPRHDAARVHARSSSTTRTTTQYAEFVRTLVEADGTPVVVHCSAGKDRTGWAIALVLLALGVPEDVVVADYLRSNEAQALRMASVSPVDRDWARSGTARTARPRARGLHLHVARRTRGVLGWHRWLPRRWAGRRCELRRNSGPCSSNRRPPPDFGRTSWRSGRRLRLEVLAELAGGAAGAVGVVREGVGDRGRRGRRHDRQAVDGERTVRRSLNRRVLGFVVVIVGIGVAPR